MLTRMEHVAIHVDDVTSALRFYTDVLGLQQVVNGVGTGGLPIAYVRLGDSSLIELTTRRGGEPMSGFHLGFECEDLDETCREFVAAGVKVLIAPRPTTPRASYQAGWRRAVFEGPHGELIEVKGP